jgi:filamin
MEDANAAKSWAEGPGLVGGKTGRHNPITVHAVDADGNNVNHGGDPFVVGIAGPSAVVPTIVDNGDGTYLIDYVVSEPGEYQIDISLHGSPIKDSPFTPLIKPDVDPSKCFAEGPGLSAAVDNETATFTIFARDGDDLPKTEGGDPFKLEFNGPAPVSFDLMDNNDGTYTVTYDPNVAGDYDINISLEGSPIKNAPYHIRVTEGIDLRNTNFKVFSFTIQTKDKNGHDRTFGGDKFEVDVKGPQPVIVSTSDNGDGTYTASYLPPHKGAYNVHVKFNDREIAASPFQHHL